MIDTNAPLRITPSAIRAFKDCSYSYALSYVERLPAAEQRIVPALAVGSAIHAVVARFLTTGAWQRRGKDELIAMLQPEWSPAAFPDVDQEAAAFERACDLLMSFYDNPYPERVSRELGVERNLAWRKPRRGLIAAGRVDRACLLDDGALMVIDFKTGRPPDRPERMSHDAQTLIYRSIAAESFAWAAPKRIIVSFRYIGAATAIEVELDRVDFVDGWQDLLVTVDSIRSARERRGEGAGLVEAFPPNRGAACRGCRFAGHCDALLGRPADVERAKEGGVE